MDDALEIVGEADTQPGGTCPRCAAHAALDAAVVRAGVLQVTTVSHYKRTPFVAVEQTKALLTYGDGSTVRGDGHSREEAIQAALDQRSSG